MYYTSTTIVTVKFDNGCFGCQDIALQTLFLMVADALIHTYTTQAPNPVHLLVKFQFENFINQRHKKITLPVI
jgi:hypothetical protein